MRSKRIGRNNLKLTGPSTGWSPGAKNRRREISGEQQRGDNQEEKGEGGGDRDQPRLRHRHLHQQQHQHQQQVASEGGEGGCEGNEGASEEEHLEFGRGDESPFVPCPIS